MGINVNHTTAPVVSLVVTTSSVAKLDALIEHMEGIFPNSNRLHLNEGPIAR